MVVALPIIGFAREPWMLVVGLMLWLFLDVFVDVAMNVQGSALSARRHTPVMNRLHGFWSLGTVTGGVVSVVLLRAGVSTPVQLTATAVVLVAALAFIAPGLLRRDEASELEEATGEIGSARAPRLAGGRVWVAVVLAAGGASAMAIEMVNGDWASFRLGDDLGARPGVAGLGFLVFTTGMTAGRLGGDFVQVRVGAIRLMRVATVVIASGTVLATLVPNVAVSVVGFLVAGLGTSVLFPQLYDRAARTPGPAGSGFASMLVGQRGAAVVAPALIGGLADSAAFDVGQAMAIVVLTCTAVMALTTFART
jgi:fucose permease